MKKNNNVIERQFLLTCFLIIFIMINVILARSLIITNKELIPYRHWTTTKAAGANSLLILDFTKFTTILSLYYAITIVVVAFMVCRVFI